MKNIVKLESQLQSLRLQLANCFDPDERAELEDQIDFIQDDIDELERDEIARQDYETNNY